jgi:energy-coupling factor transport system ATP-binding protein
MGLDLRIAQGEKMTIAGPAGSGKTTLLQLIDALMPPSGGDILYDGVSIHELARRKQLPSVRRRIGVLFQFPEEQFFQETAYDELVFSLRNFFGPEEDIIEQKASAITRGFNLDLDRLRTSSPFSLSSGEKGKLALASALMMDPEILMLDEPTAGLDASGRRELIRIISELKDTTVVIVTHNQEISSDHDRIVAMPRRKVFEGTRADLIEGIDLMERFHIKAPLVIQVQRWLRSDGIELDRISWEMEDLVSMLDRTLKHRDPD